MNSEISLGSPPHWFLILAVAVAPTVCTPSESRPVSLADSYPTEILQRILIPRADWHPYPLYGDRERWQELPQEAQSALVRRGEQSLSQPWPELTATLYLDYARTGNRSRFESVYFERRRRLHALVLAESVEARGRFLDGIVNALWSICEESSWCIPAHVGVQKVGVGIPDVSEPIVDLFAAQTAVSVAWTLYLLGSKLEVAAPQSRLRAELEIQRRILTPYLERDFGWMGFAASSRAGRPNNWNPWINASVLTAALLIEPDEARRVQLVHRVLSSLDRFIQPYPEDGGCDEGPGYWSRAAGSVQDSLDLLFNVSRGQLTVFGDSLIQNMARFIHRVHIAGDWYVALGDCAARTEIDRDLVFRCGRAMDDPQLLALATSGATLDELVGATDSIDLGRILHTLSNMRSILERRDVSPPLVASVWLGSDDLQMMVARDQPGTTRGFFVSAWGGHNAQSHNHNDVGNVIVFADGHPVFVDLGAPTYTAMTFSAHRYEIPAMQSAYHNVPTINGMLQAAGRNYAARQVKCHLSDTFAELHMDIAPAWPANTAVESWQRVVRLDRGRQLAITDTFHLLENRGNTSIHWITPRPAKEAEPGLLRLELPAEPAGTQRAVLVRYPADRLTAILEKVTLGDGRLERAWGESLTRIVMRQKDHVLSDQWALHLTLAP